MPVLALTGRTALVTGSTRGIGRAIAETLVRAGARVAVNSRDGDAARRIAAELGGGAVGIGADLLEEDAPERLVAASVDALGGLDVLVNNAGMAMASDSLELTRGAVRSGRRAADQVRASL